MRLVEVKWNQTQPDVQAVWWYHLTGALSSALQGKRHPGFDDSAVILYLISNLREFSIRKQIVSKGGGFTDLSENFDLWFQTDDLVVEMNLIRF